MPMFKVMRTIAIIELILSAVFIGIGAFIHSETWVWVLVQGFGFGGVLTFGVGLAMSMMDGDDEKK